MKSIVLYALTRTGKAGWNGWKYAREYTPVRVGCCNRIYVRAEEHQTDSEAARTNAKPRDGEIVLNSIAMD